MKIQILERLLVLLKTKAWPESETPVAAAATANATATSTFIK